jgi:hypothetical protein
MTLPAGAISIQDLRNEYYGGAGPVDLGSYSRFVGKTSGQAISLSEFHGLAAGPILTGHHCFEFALHIGTHPADVMWNLNTGALQMEAAGVDTTVSGVTPLAPVPLSVSQLSSYNTITHDCIIASGTGITFTGSYREPSAANGWLGGSRFQRNIGGLISVLVNLRVWTTRS